MQVTNIDLQGLLDYLKDNEGYYVSLTDIANAMKLDHLQKVKWRLSKLIRLGAILQDDDGIYEVVFPSVAEAMLQLERPGIVRLTQERFDMLLFIERRYKKMVKLLEQEILPLKITDNE